MLQKTLNKSFSLRGKGLHSGITLKITFNPAPVNHGYKIRRTDMVNSPVIDALAENVVSTLRGTTLGNTQFSVSTIEHALAALYASKIDNCLIDIDGPEFPIMDGSSIAFVQRILETGIINQNAKREYLYFPRKKINVKDENLGASILLMPDTSFKIECKISFDSVLLKRQEASLYNISDFVKEIASARTFVFVREIEALLEKGLIKGGSLDNAIVIYDQIMEQTKFDELSYLMKQKTRNSSHLGYLMHKPLIYSNEPARHKLLDIIGDVALVGYFIKGKIIAHNPGHTINNLFSRKIRKVLLDITRMKEKNIMVSDEN